MLNDLCVKSLRLCVKIFYLIENQIIIIDQGQNIFRNFAPWKIL